MFIFMLGKDCSFVQSKGVANLFKFVPVISNGWERGVVVEISGNNCILYASAEFHLFNIFCDNRYEDGDMTLRKVSSASNFIWSDSPLEILGSVTSITFDDSACLPIKDHDLTTEEVLYF